MSEPIGPISPGLAVAEVMRRRLITLAPELPLGAVANVMRLGRLRSLPVVAADDLLVGELSFQDCCRSVAEAVRSGSEGDNELRRCIHHALNRPVRDVMAEPENVVEESASAAAAVAQLRNAVFGHVLVVREQASDRRLVGMVTEGDLLRRFALDGERPEDLSP